MKKAILIISLVLFVYTGIQACSRVVYKGKDNLVLTGRTMDWSEDIQSNIWIFPRGMERNGMVGPNSIKWKSKYGSIITSAYDISSTDGMNEKGLVANLLWLVESQYPAWDQKKPGLTISAWVQYMLDNFATVNEAVSAMKEESFVIVSDKMPDGSRFATLHLSISDAEGDNAIFEYIDGKLVIHHDKSYQVMTNSPIFEKQLALNEYWKEIGGTVMLPGTNRAADRFVRASFYVHAIPQTADPYIGTAGIFSVIRNVSVPYGISTPNHPNISSTRWRTVSDQKNKIYYYESVLTPNTFWINFKNIDFSEKAPVKKLNLTKGEVYAGDAYKDFKVSEPFTFLGI
ncbi:linear amide C-N hydrolase [Dysgonomonas sp. Marseille-P4677]|uniref:linear amide C-N hydrolase n=1 Tax=Dysgonomonas sp. Marseille-P4677 TaxID=2364790 RepID=UPI00191210AC|nr:linear amide C-N hydrolase [Dysgonomonas sp. Marseille-P4677]MBK5722883.1 linear amide C-N hydrolase [Dysgonomonas sp. Marseille-P4677]